MDPPVKPENDGGEGVRRQEIALRSSRSWRPW